ncbi:head maturation protease, ClpP-related [Sporomusa sp. KB1]|uniref:head maturation protease, ClpP-related n=1 Tax=Sporomusa sp. KB1 TaxID=943346 RepID=UPI0011AC6D4D|nr:head maturation protease, ClpP-related [Sporomusa sp. KB1]TWH49600.1 Protease subunit of ATP-dependent Clp proteases [Sporomusa sp. KB1]
MKQEKRTWELKQSAQPDSLDMYIYGDIQADYIDWWNWELVESETSAEYFRRELAKYPDVKQINIYANSFGGSAYEAYAIRNQLKRHSAHKTGYVDGFACSAASFILTACDEVFMYSNTMQMIHDIRLYVFGNSRELRKAADDNDMRMEGNRQAYLEKSSGKITEEKLKELMEAETWLTAKQCLEYGLCDKILEQEADLTTAKQMLQAVNKTLEQQLSYHRALTAQFREMSQQSKPAVHPAPEPPPKLEEKHQQNNPKKLLAALFR